MTDKQLNGLTAKEAGALLEKYGKNRLTPEKKESFIKKAFHIVCEPMFLLLIVAAAIYFVLGEPRDGAIMLVFVVAIISIDVVQEWKTDKTLNALKDLSAPHVTVIRDGREQNIASEDLVPGDLMLIYEGVKIPADGFILRCSDLCVDESSLTGEAEGVWKRAEQDSGDDYWKKNHCYAGTLVTQGTASVRVEKTGASTEYGKIGLNVAAAKDEATPLQRQTGGLVKLCAGIAAVLFALVGVFTYLNLAELETGDRLIQSILSGITLSMAMIPEEFPVILTVFLSMGAWRLAKKNSLVRKLPAVETLGAVSVLCVDKTGTITMNQMTVQCLWTAKTGGKAELLKTMGLACEPETYDPMEKAMLEACAQNGLENPFTGKLVKEYAFTNQLKMMGHVWQMEEPAGKSTVIAAKGSPEKVLTLCPEADRQAVEKQILAMSAQGLRVIAVASAVVGTPEEIPDSVTECTLELVGLVGLADPPREGVKDDIAVCSRAGIRVVMITGDNGVTASAIARQVGMKNCENIITGDMLDHMSDAELCERVRETNVFSRVVPEHKMRIVKAFQDNGETVAMTGDGVNDAPALKHADIGIAMGKRGSEVSREAADLILMDDNFTTIVDTVRDGRRIYDNIRKAVGYVFTIHIPIALASLLAPFLGIAPAAVLLLPLHVVLLELIIDPTCSVVLERQPAESDIMERKPRNPREKLVNASILVKSLLQGLVIFAASFGTYWFTMNGSAANAPAARAMGLAVIMLSNLFLVQVNSSEHDFAYRSMARLAKDKVMWAVLLGTLLLLAVILYTPLNGFLKLEPLRAGQALAALGIAAASVLWYELVKLAKRLLKNIKSTNGKSN